MIGLLQRSFLVIHQDQRVYQNPNETWAWQGREEENGSNPTMAVAATAAGDQQLQQTANLRSKLWAVVRSKSAQEQRLAAASQLMASTFPPYSAVAANKCMNLLQQQQSDTRRAATALMMADSTFREEDVSNYSSIYGPVQDVRIPYQQENVWPYKEKGKVPDKYRKMQHQQQQMERGEFSTCG
ncbi:Zinc finger CCCH domain-containing protein 22 [Camellia lanceoleosa]|uniref:Zinc finger CCCH domain-containing protein 22 n=1 Tax=Camellia lanceoleosa TaxID=1840588 RepID=A0ACC0F7E3_9ERIC|nr:Zinc finger CCCH domain-containing protein 22 [Camellia lanceoleosa]